LLLLPALAAPARAEYVYPPLAVPGAQTTGALGINNAGQVVGYYLDEDGASHGFVYSGGSLTGLDVPRSIFTQASGINDAGHIVGGYGFGNGITPGFRSNGASFTTLSAPGATSTVALGLKHAS